MKRAEAGAGLVLPALVVVLSLFRLRAAHDYTLARLPAAALAAALLSVFAAASGRAFFRGERRLPGLLLAGFLLALVASAARAGLPWSAGEELARAAIYAVLFAAAAHLPFSPLILPAWLFGALFLCFEGLADLARGGPIVTALGNKNFFAGYLALFIPLLAAAFALAAGRARSGEGPLLLTGRFLFTMRAGGRINRKKRAPLSPARRASGEAVFLGVALAFLSVMLVLAGSQAALAGTAAGLLVTGLLLRGVSGSRGAPSTARRTAARAVLFLVLSAALVPGGRAVLWRTRASVRLPLWRGAAEMARARPFSGHGPGSFLASFQQFRPPEYYLSGVAAPVSDHAHQEYLQLAAESGLAALALFLAFLAAVFTLVARFIRGSGPGAGPAGPSPPARRFLAAGCLGGVSALLADGFFSTNLRTFTVAPLFWLTLGFAVSLSARPPDVAPGRPRAARAAWAALVAVMLLSAALLARSTAGQFFYHRAVTLRQRHDWPGAISAYRRAIALQPSNLQGAYRLAFALAADGRRAEAIESYRALLAVSPDFARSRYNLALLLLDAGRPVEALRSLEASLAHNPHHREARALAARVEEAIRAGPPAAD